MTYPEIVNAVATWILLVVTVLLLVGTMREVALLSRARARTGPDIPPEDTDGPPIGSRLPQLPVTETADATVVRGARVSAHASTLLLFISPLCESCHEVVSFLEPSLRDRTIDVGVVIVLSGGEISCRSFMRLFPLSCHVIIDSDYSTTAEFSVTNKPFGLWYDTEGILRRKKIIRKGVDLEDLVHGSTAQGRESSRLPIGAASSSNQM